MFHMIYTCNLYMVFCLRSTSLFILAFYLALSFAQDSHQMPTAPQLAQPTPTPLSSEHQVAQTHSSSPQTPQKSANSDNSAHIQTHNQNIVTDNVQHTNSQATHEDTKIDHGLHHEAKHEQGVENNQAAEHNGQSGTTREHIRKMLSQMTEQQLVAFQQTLSGEALHYYTQIMQENAQHQHQEQLQYQQQYAQVEQQLSKTDIEAAKQEEQYQKEEQKFENQLIVYNDYLFELDEQQTETFRITIPVSQRIIVQGYTYENDEGVYTATKDIEEHQPILFRIYENDAKILYQKEFYFKYFGSFMGNENSTYVLRFYNPSHHKLISLGISTIFQKGHVADKATVHDMSNHSRRLDVFQNQITQKYNDVMMRSALDNYNREGLIKRLDHYYIFSFVQLGVLLGLCLMQVEFVRKVLSNNNVV